MYQADSTVVLGVHMSLEDSIENTTARARRTLRFDSPLFPANPHRRMILPAATAASLWGVTVCTWNRLYLTGKVPPPVMVSDDLIGWRLFELIDAKEAEAARAKRAKDIAAFKAANPKTNEAA
jgi:hypothetical protein